MNRSSLTWWITALGMVRHGAWTAIGTPAGNYRSMHKCTFGGAGGQEYFDCITLDAASRRVYLPRRSEVPVVTRAPGRWRKRFPA